MLPGPASVIEAVAAGKRAAESIERYLNGKDMLADRFESTVKPVPEELLPSTKNMEKKTRASAAELAADSRIGNFDEVEAAFSVEEALAEAERCLNCALCSECMECVAACDKKAIDHAMKEQIVELEVGSVILTPGFEEFDAERKGEFGYDRYANVVTSVQFERMLSAAGPFGGHVVRRIDGREAKRIAWIQCVGSRDSKCGNEYCSSICCMATTKQALVADEHIDGHATPRSSTWISAPSARISTSITSGPGARKISITSRASRRALSRCPGSMDIRLRYIDENVEHVERDFDLVVLAVGWSQAAVLPEAWRGSASSSMNSVSAKPTGFSRWRPRGPACSSPARSRNPRTFPKRSPRPAPRHPCPWNCWRRSRNTLITKKKYPVEHDITDEEPRIGVFVCHCGMNIASTVDVEKVTERHRRTIRMWSSRRTPCIPAPIRACRN